MRLTLRTLLAYMDDILEDEDKKILKAKIDESAFATELIAKIRTAVDHRGVPAHSPDALGPLENANTISEYLDSTLAPEQITEIERHCLESQTTLAEAAACHQILTVALGQPAQVPETLKQRIYQLPQSASATPNTAGQDTPSFSAVDIPAEASEEDPAIAAAFASAADAATSVRPVGPNDSGVSDAPTRLRNAPGAADEPSEAEIVAGATRAAIAGTDGYGGNVRPSRITPWLVTLAMAGVVLYALGQIFAPLTKPRVREMGAVAIDDSPLTRTLEPTVPLEADEAPTPESESEAPADASSTTESTSGNIPAAPARNENDESSAEPTADAQAMANASTDANETTAEPTQPMKDGSAEQPTNASSQPNQPEPSVTPEPEAKSEPDAVVARAEQPSKMESESQPTTATKSESEPTTGTPTVPSPPENKPGPVLAYLDGKQSLVLVQQIADNQSSDWARLLPPPADNAVAATNPAAPVVRGIRSGQAVIAPALYRPILNHPSGLEWTLAGPTRIRLSKDAADGIVTDLVDGRVLLASTQAGATTTLKLGDRHVKVVMPQAQTVLAVEVAYRRPLGLDPLVPQNRMPFYRVISVQGDARIQPTDEDARSDEGGDDAATIATGKQWGGRGVEAAVVTTVDRLPTWTDPPEKADALVESAREGLLEFLSDNEPLEKSLREAMSFRRVEVAALAAETLLLLGRADVYFGADGILSRPRQRLYWSEHFEMLRQYAALSAQSASQLREAIRRSELADSDSLFKLIVGYSQTQLEAGGDEELVKFLDSPSMPVRVLAIENLKSIVGDSLNYRADNENANARKNDIKKWEARLRRGDIRYDGK